MNQMTIIPDFAAVAYCLTFIVGQITCTTSLNNFVATTM
jgi:hypothetical protein